MKESIAMWYLTAFSLLFLQSKKKNKSKRTVVISGVNFFSIPIPSAEFEKHNEQQMAELVQLLKRKTRGSISRNDQTIKQESNNADTLT